MGLMSWLQKSSARLDTDVVTYVKTHPDAFGADICEACNLSRAHGFLRFSRLEEEGRLVSCLEALNKNDVRLPRRRFRAA